MKLITFTYTKDDGKKSKRVLAVHTEPQRLFGGTDISELTKEEVAEYMAELKELKFEYMQAVARLNDSFDLNHQFRQFKPENMSEIVVDEM